MLPLLQAGSTTATFSKTWRGALAHAIFFHEGSLDYTAPFTLQVS